MFINICSAKSDWIHNTKNATVQDFIEQKKHLEDVLEPIMLKLNTQCENWYIWFIRFAEKLTTGYFTSFSIKRCKINVLFYLFNPGHFYPKKIYLCFILFYFYSLNEVFCFLFIHSWSHNEDKKALEAFCHSNENKYIYKNWLYLLNTCSVFSLFKYKK